MKKKSGVFSFRVNDILTSLLSALHPFLTLPKDVLKRKRGTFFGFQAIGSWKAQKGPFFPVGSDVLKSAKMVPFFQLEVMLLKVRKRYLFKNIKKCFQAFGKPVKILPIDICQPLAPLELQWTMHRLFVGDSR